MSTYEIIKALPGKGTDWAGFQAALRTLMVGEYIRPETEARWAEKGIRAARGAAMEMATIIVHRASVRSTFIAPSPETLSWGGFLGGETVVFRDGEAAEQATHEIAKLAARFGA